MNHLTKSGNTNRDIHHPTAENTGRYQEGKAIVTNVYGFLLATKAVLSLIISPNYLCLLTVWIFKPSIWVGNFMPMIILYLQKTKCGIR